MPFLRSVKKVSYRRRTAAFIVTWRRGEAVPTVSEMSVSYLEEDRRRYGMSLNGGTACANPTSRRKFVCVTTYRLVGIMWRCF